MVVNVVYWSDTMDVHMKITSKVMKIWGIPFPSFEFLMILSLVLALVWWMNIPGSFPLA